MGDDLYELPEGWVWTKFEELVQEFQNGLSKRKGLQGKPTHVLRLADIVNSKIASTEPRDILLTNEELAKYLLRVNELVCIRVNGSDNLVGRLVIFNEKEPWAFCDHFIKITLIEGLISVFYIFHLFNTKTIRDYISLNKVSSAGQNTVSQTTVSAIRIPLPPFPEQHRIVAKIEELFTQLDAGVELLKKLKTKLKRYRQAVLKAAVEGNLTKEWREANKSELEPASILLERILKHRREKWEAEQLAKMKAKGKTPKDDRWKSKYKEPIAPDTSDLPELPDGWCWVSLEMLGDVIGGLTKNSKRDKLSLKMPYLRVANVYAGQLKLDEIQKIGVLPSEVNRVLLQKGDLLVVEGNGSIKQIGRVALWDGSISPCLHQNHIIKVRFNPIKIAKYAILWLLSIGGRNQITLVASSTSGLHTLNLSKVSALTTPLPPLTEQFKIVEEVELYLSIIEQLEKTVETNLKRAEKLRQSILKQAFEGKLVPQDSNDEPAEKLLERIKAEKAKREAENKPKRTKKPKSSSKSRKAKIKKQPEAENKLKNQPQTETKQPQQKENTAIQLELFNDT